MILDTTFLVDLLRGNPEAITKVSEIERRNETIATTTISVFEIWQGMPKNASEKQVVGTLELFKSINILSLDFDSALEAGEIQRKLKSSGKKIDPEDAMIAGVAKTRREKVLTRNEKHFKRINGLEIETY